MAKKCPHCGEKTVELKAYFRNKNKCASCGMGYRLGMNFKRYACTVIGLYLISILVDASYTLAIIILALLVSFTPKKSN